MLEVKILGTGCMKCDKLFEITRQAIETSGVQADLQKVQKLDQIMSYGVMLTPAIVIDGQVRASGKIPSSDEIVSWLTGAASGG